MKRVLSFFLLLTISTANLFSVNPNQTSTVSSIFSEHDLPFTIQVETADFMLPEGVHSGAIAVYKDYWLIFAGRTNGLHGFDNNNNNFPPSRQNTDVIVVNSKTKTVYTRSLYDLKSGLTHHEIDLLSVTSPQSYQDGKILYMTGGYGVDSATGNFTTKDALTAVNVPKLINWVLHRNSQNTARECIQQIFDPLFQVTGGYMSKNSKGLTLLVFGQDFEGPYIPSSDGVYTEQVRRFYIKNTCGNLSFTEEESFPEIQDPNYRRRDLNVVPIVLKSCGCLQKSFVALSGVFTPDVGIWTVPVFISNNGVPFMRDPLDSNTFKQGMNNYVSATIGLFSAKENLSYTILLGGISYEFFQNGIFQTDLEFPFINQITTIQIDEEHNCRQFLMNAEYPVILSTGSNPGNPFLFGAGAVFIPSKCLPKYQNDVIKFDSIKNERVFLGYIVGGIASTLPNTNTQADSTASPYIFKVYMTKK